MSIRYDHTIGAHIARCDRCAWYQVDPSLFHAVWELDKHRCVDARTVGS